MNQLVVDASVAFKWLMADREEEDVPAAKALLRDHLDGRIELHVPALLYWEVGNVLVCGKARLPTPEVEGAISDLLALPLVVAVPGAVEAAATARLARAHHLTFYDAAYVALAEALDCVVVTADARLARKVKHRARLLARS